MEHRKVIAARSAYEYTVAANEAGVGTYDAVIDASAELAKAEEQVLFADVVRARALHVARVSAIVSRYWFYVNFGEAGQGGEEGMRQAQERLSGLQQKLLDAQQRLHDVLSQ